MQTLNPNYLFPSPVGALPGAILFLTGTILTGITLNSVTFQRAPVG